MAAAYPSGAGPQRLDAGRVDPAAYEAVLGMERYVRSSGLAPALTELVKIRASQLNGCAFCLDMHHRDARERGEDQRRLDMLSAWREVPGYYTDQEQAVLALTEEVTRLGPHGVPDPVWDRAAQQLSEQEMVWVLMTIATINVWNRLAVTTRQQPPERAEPQQEPHESTQKGAA